MYKNHTDLTFEQINIFLTAAKFENFSKAATALDITQPSVSRNISAMEDTLGIVLFVRHQRRVQLTRAGRFLYEEFDRLMQQTSSIVDKAYQVQGNQFDTLKISSANVLRNNQYLLPVVQQFRENYPQVDVSLEIMDPYRQIDLLIGGSYDVGVVASAYTNFFKKNGLIVRSIRKTLPAIILSSRHPLYEMGEENIADLLASPIVALSDENNLYAQCVHEILRELNLPHGDITSVSNLDTVAAMIDIGNYIYIGDRFIHFNTTEEIKCIPLGSVSTSLGLSVAYRVDSENIFIRKFVSLLEEAGWPE